MKNKIILLVHEGFFTQRIGAFNNVNLDEIRALIAKNGLSSELLEYSQLASFSYNVDNSAIYWCGSHQNRDVKAYINDVLTARFSDRDNLIPSLKTILAHENKGIMGMLASELALDFIPQDYLCVAQDIDVQLPVVTKLLSGAGSIGVALAKNRTDIKATVAKAKRWSSTLQDVKDGLKNVVRSLRGKQYQAD